MQATVNGVNTIFNRVDRLLVAELGNILRRERGNANRVHLYCVGDHWVAFETSAYLLAGLTRSLERPMVLHLQGHPFPLVMHHVPARRLDELCRSCSPARQSLSYLQLVADPVDAPAYARWYRNLVIDPEEKQ